MVPSGILLFVKYRIADLRVQRVRVKCFCVSRRIRGHDTCAARAFGVNFACYSAVVQVWKIGRIRIVSTIRLDVYQVIERRKEKQKTRKNLCRRARPLTSRVPVTPTMYDHNTIL